MGYQGLLKKLLNSIGTKIVFPYIVLTLFVAGIGAFIITSLVTGTLQERLDNQLLDAGRVVAEVMVTAEQERLSVLRAVENTLGVSEALKNQDNAQLASLVPQIVINSDMDAVALLSSNGEEIYSWYKNPESALREIPFAEFEDVSLVLEGFSDGAGTRRVMLARHSNGYLLFTIGPVFHDDELVGALLIGTEVSELITVLTENAVARVTLYDPRGNVIGTSLAIDPGDTQNALQESPEKYQLVSTNAENAVTTKNISVRNQDYLMAFGDWRLRDQSFGMYSVALPTNFLLNAAATSRNTLSWVFSIATIAVIAIGYAIAGRVTAQRICAKIQHLVAV